MENPYDSIVPLVCPSYERAMSEFSARSGDARTIVELGVGTGNVARSVLERNPGAKYVAVDSDVALLELARKKLAGFDVSYHCADFGAFVLPSADIVVSSLAVHHLEQGAQLSLFERIMRSSGRFLHFELVAGESPEQQRAYDVASWQYIAGRSHLTGRSLEDLRRAFDAGALKDKPLPVSAHKSAFKTLDLVFQDVCFVFYDARNGSSS